MTIPAMSDSRSSNDLQTLYVEHQAWLRGWLRNRLGCMQQASDLTQDTFVRLIVSGEAPNLRTPRAFLLTVARRVLYNFWRRRDLEQAYLDSLAELPPEYAPSEEDRLLALDAVLAVDRLLDGLSVAVRQAFLMHRLDGLPQQQIAKVMGCSLATVERHIRHAYLHVCQAGRETP